MGWVRSKLGHLNREARRFISQSSSPGPFNGPLDTTDVSTHSVHVTHAGDKLPILKLFSVKAAIAELFATAMFVYIGTGTAVTFSSRVDYSGDGGYTGESLNFTAHAPAPVSNLDEAADVARNTQEFLTEFGQNILVNGSWGVTVAFAFGLAITVLAFATGHISGGQLNPAVTFALACVGSLPFGQAIANTISQVVGAILGSALLDATIPDGNGGSLGSNSITPGVGYGNALCGEIVMTGVLVATVL